MMADADLDDLRRELDGYAEPQKALSRPPREERIIAGFEEIQRFVQEHGRLPRHSESNDIFERVYAVRLDRLRAQPDCVVLLEEIDHQGLLLGGKQASPENDICDDDLAAELADLRSASPISELKHVRPSAERQAAEEIANREPCKDFARYKPLFEKVQKELDTGVRETRPFERKAEIEQGRFFVLGGQKAYIAEIGESFTQEYGDRDARMRVIFDNGTESNMLMRSLQRALHKDSAGRRITEATAGPLFADRTAEGDVASGTIYVLRSKSSLPVVIENHSVLHKIGVTSGKVERRITNAKLDPTFLMAEVEIVATYELFNINRGKLENLIHRIFEPARLSITVRDRFGNAVVPREWFLVPLSAISDAVQKIKDGTIAEYIYDPRIAAFVKRDRFPA